MLLRNAVLGLLPLLCAGKVIPVTDETGFTFHTNHPAPETLNYGELRQWSMDLSEATAKNTPDGKGMKLTGLWFHKTIEDYASWFRSNYADDTSLNRTLARYYANVASGSQQPIYVDEAHNVADTTGYACGDTTCDTPGTGTHSFGEFDTEAEEIAFQKKMCTFVGNAQPYLWAVIGYTVSYGLCAITATPFVCGLIFSVVATAAGIYVGPAATNICNGGLEKLEKDCERKSGTVPCDESDDPSKKYDVHAVSHKLPDPPSCPSSNLGSATCGHYSCKGDKTCP